MDPDKLLPILFFLVHVDVIKHFAGHAHVHIILLGSWVKG